MIKFLITVFVLSLLFTQNALAGGHELLKSILRGAAKQSRQLPTPEKEIANSLQDLEERLWGQSFEALSESDAKACIESDFMPADIVRSMDENRKELTSHPSPPAADEIDEIVKINAIHRVATQHVQSPVYLRWWDNAEDFRSHAFLYLDKRHLSGNHELLMRWWDEIKVRVKKAEESPDQRNSMEKDKIVHYIRGSLESIIEKYPSDFRGALGTDPFLRTVIRAINENRTFADDIKPVFNKLLREHGFIDDDGRAVPIRWSDRIGNAVDIELA